MKELEKKPAVKKKKYTMDDWIGSIKGGPKTNVAADLDDVLYGEMTAH